MDELAQIKDEKRINMPRHANDHEDGIYFGMSEEEYHKDSALGASGIVDLTVSPLAFWTNSAWNKRRKDESKDEKETDATIRGTYFHEALAGGKSSIIVKPAGMSFATKEGKEFKARYEGKTFIKAEDTETVQDMIDAMRETGVLEKIGGVGGGISEVSVFWTDKAGRRRKFRIDRLFEGNAFDWKTMQNSAKKDLETLVAHTVAQHRYHIKAYWYQSGLQSMKAMINAQGAKAFKSHVSEKDFQAMYELSQTDTIVPFWYVFLENSGVPNIVVRRFVSHDDSGELNAYFRAAKQETERALGIFDAFMRSHGPEKRWHSEVYFKPFTDSEFMAARWILAED